MDVISRADAMRIIDEYELMVSDERESISKSARLSLTRYLRQKLAELKPVEEYQITMEIK